MIKIFEDMRDPYDHPLNSNGTFEKTGRCKHQDNRGTDCTRNALIKENPFCFEHMPASIMLKALPLPELQGTLYILFMTLILRGGLGTVRNK